MTSLEFLLPRTTGSIAWKDEKNEPGVDTKTLVDHRFSVVQNMIEEATADFASALDSMRASLAPIVVNSIPTSGIEVTEIGAAIPDFVGTFDTVFSAVLPEFSVSYTEPEGKPDSSAFEWEEGIFSLTAELVDKLAFWLLNGESAIPQALFDEMYLTATTALSEDVTARRLVLVSEAAARGWDCPAEIESAKLLQLEREYSKGAAEVASNIAVKNMELVQANFHKAVEVSAQYISTQMDYNIRKNSAKIDFYVASVDAWVKQVDAEISRITAEVTAFQGQVEGYKAAALVYKTEADVFDSTVRAYVALVEGMKAKIGAAVESIKAEVMVYEVDSKVAIENEKLRVEAQIANNELGQRIAEADSNFHAQLMASGMGALHVQAGVSASHSTGEQVGFSYQYGENYGEQQSRSENTSTTREVV